MLSRLLLSSLTLACAYAACPSTYPTVANAYACSMGSRTDSTGTSKWARYCCNTGAAPTGNATIYCNNGATWSAVTFTCPAPSSSSSGSGSSSAGSSSGSSSSSSSTTNNVCGAPITPYGPFTVPKHGSQCSDTSLTCSKPDHVSKPDLYPISIGEVVDRHNCWRKNVNPAAKKPLPALKWDDGLKRDAERWAAQCPDGHDTYPARAQNKSTDGVSWQYVGQNICYASFNRSWSACIDAWAMEQKDFVWGQGSNGKGQTGHYTQVVAERSTYVGCGWAFCPTKGMSYVQVCNYGPAGNFNGGEKVPYTKA